VDKQKKQRHFREETSSKKLWPGKIPKTKYSASCKTIQILFGKPDQITQQELYF